MSIGPDLRVHRLRRNVSLTSVARAAGVPKQHLSMIERGLANPTIAVVAAVAGQLGLELALRRKAG